MDFPGLLEREAQALLAAVEHDLDQAVPACPGWDARRLVSHVGRLLRSTATHLPRGTTAPPDRPPPAPADDAELLRYYRQALADVVEVMRRTDPNLPAWNFTAAPQASGFWPRRLAHELLVHRWDAENAANRHWAVEAGFAADGVDEVLTILLPAARAAGAAPVADDGTAHVHLTDVEGEWLVRLDGATTAVTAEHAKGDAALRGPAATVLLALWGRVPMDADGLAAFGSAELLRSLLPGR